MLSISFMDLKPERLGEYDDQVLINGVVREAANNTQPKINATKGKVIGGKAMIREGETPVAAPDANEIVNRIIQEVKEKPWTVPQKRAEIVARLKNTGRFMPSLTGERDTEYGLTILK